MNHDMNNYQYTITIEDGLLKTIFRGNVIGSSRPQAYERLMQQYDCKKEEIKLECVQCVETDRLCIKLCPMCKSDLIKDTSISYASFPEQYNYLCRKCGHKTIGT